MLAQLLWVRWFSMQKSCSLMRISYWKTWIIPYSPPMEIFIKYSARFMSKFPTKFISLKSKLSFDRFCAAWQQSKYIPIFEASPNRARELLLDSSGTLEVFIAWLSALSNLPFYCMCPWVIFNVVQRDDIFLFPWASGSTVMCSVSHCYSIMQWQKCNAGTWQGPLHNVHKVDGKVVVKFLWFSYTENKRKRGPFNWSGAQLRLQTS